MKQDILSHGHTVLVPPIFKCPNELIEGGCSSSKSANSVPVHRSCVQITSTWYLRNEFKETSGHNVMGFRASLVLAFSIQAIQDEFDFDFLSGIVVNQIISPSRDDICILPFKFVSSKVKSICSMPIVLVNKGQAPIRTISFSLILSS